MVQSSVEQKISIEVGILSSLAFFILKVLRLFQSGIARVFWWLTIVPALQIAKVIDADKELPEGQRRNREGKPFVVLDCLKWHHKTLWSYLQSVFNINSALSGHQGRFGDLFEFLLSWNPKVPLIGFVEDKVTFTIELLFNFTPDGKNRGCNFVWLSTQKRFGTFQIVDRIADKGAGGNVRLGCVWMSGKDAGKTFEMAKLPDLRDKPNVTLPTAVYFPPKIAVFFMELLFSAGAIIAFFQLTKEGWKVVGESITDLLGLIKVWVARLL